MSQKTGYHSPCLGVCKISRWSRNKKRSGRSYENFQTASSSWFLSASKLDQAQRLGPVPSRQLSPVSLSHDAGCAAWTAAEPAGAAAGAHRGARDGHGSTWRGPARGQLHRGRDVVQCHGRRRPSLLLGPRMVTEHGQSSPCRHARACVRRAPSAGCAAAHPGNVHAPRIPA